MRELESGTQPGLVGRERQLREIGLVLDALRGGRGNVLLFTGEAGVGKTRLAEEATDRARAAGSHVAWVSCWSDAAAPPFWPWDALLDQLGVGERWSGAPAGGDPGGARFEQFEAAWRTLRQVADAAPRLLVIDDLQWADTPSVRLLAFLAPLLHGAPLAVVATCRDEEVDGRHRDALSAVVRHARRLVVPPLSRNEFVEFVTGLPDRAVALDIDALYDRTGGNPLFAREILRGVGEPDVAFASGMHATLTNRRRRLSPAADDLLALGAVMGAEFRVDVLAEVAGSEDSVLELLDEAERARLVREGGFSRWCFAHPLLREVAYADLGVARRVRLHQHVGEALERLHARGVEVSPAELAHHFSHAAPAGNAAKALRYAEAAGNAAMEMLAYEDAAARFEQALSALDLLPAADERRTELLLALGDARVASGDLPAARDAYSDAAALARRAGLPDRLARAALGLGSGPGGFEVAPFDREQLDMLEESLTGLAEPSALKARVLARLSVALSLDADWKRREALSEDAVTIAREAGDPVVLGHALASWCDVVAGPADVERRRAASEEVVELGRRAGERSLELLGRRLRFVALVEAGDFRSADDEIQTFAQLADAIRQPLYRWYPALWRGMRAAMEGRVDEANRLCALARSIGDAAHSDNAWMLTESLRTYILVERLEATEAVSFFRQFADDPGYGAMTRPAVAFAAATTGDRDGALAVLDSIDLAQYDDRVFGSEWMSIMVQLADACWNVGGHRLAAGLYEALLPFRDRFAVDGIGDWSFGSLERPLAVLAAQLGRRDDAVEHFDRALERHHRLGASLLLARTLLEAGQALGDRDKLVEARALYTRMGFEARVAQLDALLAGTGGHTWPRPAREGNVFRREGDVWVVAYASRATNVRDAKGLRDLARLLASPGREIHALDLAGDGVVVQAGDTGPLIDATARARYRARLLELDEELAEADAAADAGRSERLAAERDALLAQLGAAYGLGGRARHGGDAAERARSAVTQRVREAIRRLAGVHPELGAHLRASVKTGTYCSYRPEAPVEWEL